MDFFDFYQERRIHRANVRAAHSERQASDAQERALELEKRFDHLLLLNTALWSLLKEHVGLTDEQLVERMREIDAADGQADGKITPQMQACPQCGRTLSRKQQRCLFCNYTPPNQDAFRPATR